MIGLPYELFFVLDVESVGLFGEGFAAGWVVIKRSGAILSYGLLSCDPAMCEGSEEGRKWVAENVPHLSGKVNSPVELRALVWDAWKKSKADGAVMASECPWPVEARFLLQAAQENQGANDLQAGPYPLLDISSMLVAIGEDPLAPQPRLESELPPHDPLADATQSARILAQILRKQDE